LKKNVRVLELLEYFRLIIPLKRLKNIYFITIRDIVEFIFNIKIKIILGISFNFKNASNF